ncbi:MAG: rhodanese-like domain-containing protein [Cryomorphaceae bacterium]|nr:rhodanese-like domain-containing protein [Flavobacteriales bacterium]
MNAIDIIKTGKGKVVDVRSHDEFVSGNVPGSINIPLPEVAGRMEEFRSMEGPFLMVCASGNRSGIASMMLQREGIESYNAGGWSDFNAKMSAVQMS